MSRVEAIYYDGKTAKPTPVFVAQFKRDLVFYETSTSLNVIRRWPVLLCKSEHFNDSSSLQISFGKDFPKELVEIPSPTESLIKLFQAQEIGEKYLFDKVLKGNALKVIASGIFILAVLVFVYINWVSFYVGNTIVSFIPQNLEETIGEKAFYQYSPLLALDSSKSKILKEFYAELGYASDYGIEPYYDSSSMVNAFALPGGKVIVYKGLIDKTETWEELAALLGHEVSHINNRHSLRLMSRQIGNYAVFSAITGDMAGISSVMIESAITLHELVNSRAYETEADKVGLQMMIEQNIDPYAMIGLFQRLYEEHQEIEEFVDEYKEEFELLSTHPLTQNRMQFIDNWISENLEEDFKAMDNGRAEELWNKLKE